MPAGSQQPQKVGVLVLAHGGPRSLDEVEGFARRLLGPERAQPETVRRLEARYRAIGGGSPLAEETEYQARLVEEFLDGPGSVPLRLACGAPVRVAVFTGTRFGQPAIADAVAHAAEFAGSDVVGIIMSSHPPAAVIASYQADVDRAFADIGAAAQAQLCPSFASVPQFLDAVAGKVQDTLAGLGEEGGSGEDVLVLFAAHSLPVKEGYGDGTYERALFETARKVVAKVGVLRWQVAYQSRPEGARGEWLGPSTEEVVARETAKGTTRFVVVPLVFVAEHLETLYDLDIDLRRRAEEHGAEMWRVPTVGSDPLFIEALGMTVVDGLRQRAGRGGVEMKWRGDR